MTKYKININRPEISTEEIVQNKDFNIVLKKFKREKRLLYKIQWPVIYLLIIVLVLTGFFAAKIIDDIQSKKKPTNNGDIELQRPY